jgi:putative endonuclease
VQDHGSALFVDAPTSPAMTPALVMPGLVPGIHVLQSGLNARGWVYILTNRPNGILYTGVTGNMARRAGEHRKGIIAGFTRRYGVKRLVWCEHHDTIIAAIQRERTMKHWPRAWKIRLILAANPDWDDLYETIGQ